MQQVHLPWAPEAPGPDTSGLPTQQLIINQLIIQAMVEHPWTLQPWTLNPASKPGQRLRKHSRGHTNRGHSRPPLRPLKRTHLSTYTDQREAEAACLGTATLPGHSHPSQARLIKPLPQQCWQEGDFSRSRTSTGIANSPVSTEPAREPTAGHDLGKDYLSRTLNTLQQCWVSLGEGTLRNCHPCFVTTPRAAAAGVTVL